MKLLLNLGIAMLLAFPQIICAENNVSGSGAKAPKLQVAVFDIDVYPSGWQSTGIRC